MFATNNFKISGATITNINGGAAQTYFKEETNKKSNYFLSFDILIDGIFGVAHIVNTNYASNIFFITGNSSFTTLQGPLLKIYSYNPNRLVATYTIQESTFTSIYDNVY